MICTELYDGQGLGNQLWSYVVCRVIAEHKGCGFSILSKNEFKGKDFMELDFGVEFDNNFKIHLGPNLELPAGITNYYQEQKEHHLNEPLLVSRTDENLFKIPDNTKIDGILQSTKYLSGKRDDIIRWLKIKAEKKLEYYTFDTDENTCVIHIRCGDFYGQKNIFLPASYYVNAMNKMTKLYGISKFSCVTDQPEIVASMFPSLNIIGSARTNEYDKYMASHHFGGPIGKDFMLLMNAKYVIIPNSTFSWWAAYLNTSAKTIIAPKFCAAFNTSNGYWSLGDTITDGFTYLDRDGNYFTSEQCWIEKTEFEKNNENLFIKI